jgi:hypothetical protein
MLVWHLLQPKRLGHQPSVGSQPPSAFRTRDTMAG